MPLAQEAELTAWFRCELEAIPIQTRLRGVGEVDLPKGGTVTIRRGKGRWARKSINVLSSSFENDRLEDSVCSLSL